MTNCHAELLNELLRLELTASLTYRRAMPHVDEIHTASMLQGIYEHHRAAVETLCKEIRQMGCEPDHACDDALAPDLADQDILNGGATAIQALRQGETTGLHSYEGALRDHHL